MKHEVATGEHVLEVIDAGEEHGPAIFYLHGTPSCAQLYSAWAEDASSRGLRLVSYSRPGYGESSRRQGRDVAQCVNDVTAIADALDIDRFAVWGISGGGPHALACAALLNERAVAAVSLASIAPWDSPGLDFLAGMGEDNIVEFNAALQGQSVLTPIVDAQLEGMTAASPQRLAEQMKTVLSPVDRAVLDDDFGVYLASAEQHALSQGSGGWVDDDLAFVMPWGFDISSIRVPLQIWQGGQDLMVPPAHGAWLASRVPAAEFKDLPEDGHLALVATRIPEVHAWLAEHF